MTNHKIASLKMAKQFKIVIILLIIIGLGATSYFFYKYINVPEIIPSPRPSENLVGADRDEHGCIGSAGYTWCEVKNKCLRSWEESCSESIDKEIQSVLAKKYNKSIDEVKITIGKQVGNFASGSVMFGEGGIGEGGIFLATKIGNEWSVVFDGNGNVDCTKMRQEYDFPDEILKPNFCD